MFEAGFFADVVIFDPASINNHVTFEKPHQYTTGVEHVFVNGRHVLKNRQHIGDKLTKIVKGASFNK